MMQIRNTWSEFVTKAIKYAAIGVIVVPLTIVTHELGHYFAYKFFGAPNVVLHSVSVSADKDTLRGVQIAIASIVGPIISYVTIGLAYFFTQKKYIPFWIIVGLAAPIGRIVNFVYVYFRVLGYSPNPNFDEFNFSRSLNIEPLWLSVFTILVVLATLLLLFRKAWKWGKFVEVASVIFSLVVGLSVWMFLGGLILP
ncbi:MAG: hypothetical protein WBD27_16105 [Pyrinomonadaceae bacterium]